MAEGQGSSTLPRRTNEPPRSRARWTKILAWCGVAVVGVGIGVGVFFGAPPIIRNLNTHVSDGGELTLQDGALQAAVAISDDWVFIQGGAATGEVLTPDGVLHARLTLVGDAPAAALRTEPGPLREETLASGLIALHTDLAADGLIAAVGRIDGESVRIEIELPSGTDADAYREAVATLLEGVRL